MAAGQNEGITIGSYWESTVGMIKEDRQLVGEALFEVAVIGGGITGLSTALRLAEAGVSVCVLDGRRVGWGASGRNGGFCCLGGSKLDGPKMEKLYGEAEAKRFVNYQIEAIEKVRDRIGRWKLDVDHHSRGELYLAHRPKAYEEQKDEVEYLNKSYGLGASLLTKEEIREQGADGPEFFGAMHVPQGFALNPMKYVLGIASAARAAGARIYAHTEVREVGREGEKWILHTRMGKVKASRVVLAGGGYSREDAPKWLHGRIMPVMSSVMVTRPMSDDELAAQGWTSDTMASDSRILLHYFRLMPDKRFLFGTRGGLFESPAALETMQKRARADFERMFPAWRHVESDFKWHGHVSLARDLTPYVGPVPDMSGVYASLCYHGSGVAMASLSGEKLADMILGRVKRKDLPGPMQQPLRKFPMPLLRQFYLQGAYTWYGLKDRF